MLFVLSRTTLHGTSARNGNLKEPTWSYFIAVNDSAELETAAVLLALERRQEQLPETVELRRPRRVLCISVALQATARFYVLMRAWQRMLGAGLPKAELYRCAQSAVYRFRVSAGESTAKSCVAAGFLCSGNGVATNVEANVFHSLDSQDDLKPRAASCEPLGPSAEARAARMLCMAFRDRLWRITASSSLAFFVAGSMGSARQHCLQTLPAGDVTLQLKNTKRNTNTQTHSST